MAKLRKSPEGESKQPSAVYRRNYLYNSILDKIVNQHEVSLSVQFKSHPGVAVLLKMDELREFIWLLRSKESEDNIDIWVSKIKKIINNTMAHMHKKEAHKDI